MRISDGLRFQQAYLAAEAPRSRLAVLEEQAGTGRRINRPSDDPSGMALSLDLRTVLSNVDQYRRNIARGRTLLGASEDALASAAEQLQRLQELAVAGANGTLDEANRRAIAREVRGALDTLLGLANSRVGDTYLFGGFRTDAAPFAADGTYGGDSRSLTVEVAEGVRSAVTVSGDVAFVGAAGEVSAFDAVRNLAEALEENDADAVRGSMDGLQAAMERISDARASLGARLNQLDVSESVLERVEAETRSQLSATEDADLLRVASDLRLQETTLQAALAATARIIQPTLLDYLK